MCFRAKREILQHCVSEPSLSGKYHNTVCVSELRGKYYNTVCVSELSLSGKYYNTFTFLINVQQAFTFINSSVNFLIYYTTGTKYRTTFHSLCCKARTYRAPNLPTPVATSTTKVTDPVVTA